MVEFPSLPGAGPLSGPMPESPSTRAGPPTVVRHARGFVRFLYTSNPFYVISAGLVLWGLWSSFDRGAGAVQSRALMAGLSGYTVLLAAAGVFLIRVGRVWQDVRTILLLVVLMFLANSVSFDETLAEDPQTGIFHIFLGLVFSFAVSEAVLWGIGLRLRGWFRTPYYLLLTVFFLYPVALSPMIHRPREPATLWGLFGFAPVAAVALVTLLPAVRRGPEYANANGSPWRWPLYPWVLFGVLGFGVCARADFLCTSLHAAKGPYSIFGPYFLVPFLFAANVLLMEMGIVGRRPGVMALALLAPLGLLGMAATGPAYLARDLGFLAMFIETLGASPLYLTLAGATAFYLIAAMRRVPAAWESLGLALGALSLVGPRTVDLGTLVGPQGWALVAVAVLESGLAIARRSSFRAMLAAVCAAAGLSLELQGTAFTACGGAIPLNLLLAAALVIGAAMDDPFARFLRRAGAGLLLAAGAAWVVLAPRIAPSVPPEAAWAYAPALAAVAAVYGRMFRLRRYDAAAGGTLACWLAAAGYRGYLAGRPLIAGLGQIAIGLGFFLLAVAISLWKTGLPQQWIARWRRSGAW